MYCPTCGAQLAQAMSYCYRCGANLSMFEVDGQAEKSGRTIDTLVWVIVGTTITLLGMALGALVLMKDGTIDARLGSVFVLMSFVALVVVEAVLVWQLLRLNSGRALGQSKDLSTEELGPAQTRALPNPADPMQGVAEQTTRALEPSYREGERL